MTLKIEGSKIYKEVHVNSKGENVEYYSVCVFYRHTYYSPKEFRSSIESDWIAAIDGKLMTETDCYIGYHDEYHLEDFPLEEIQGYQDISIVNSYYSDEDKRKIYELFSQELSKVLVGFEKELSALHCNSLHLHSEDNDFKTAFSP